MDRKLLHGARWAGPANWRWQLVLEAPEAEDGLGDLTSPWPHDDAGDTNHASDALPSEFPELELVVSSVQTSVLAIAV